MLIIYNMVKWIWLIVFSDRINQAIRDFFFKAKIANISVCNQVIKFTTISEIKYKDNMFLSPIFGSATYSMTKLKFLNNSNPCKRCWLLPFSLQCFVSKLPSNLETKQYIGDIKRFNYER